MTAYLRSPECAAVGVDGKRMRLYFNLKHPFRSVADETGIELDNLDPDQIRAAVEEFLEEEDAQLSSETADWTLEVTNSSGSILLSIDLGALDR